MHYKTEQAGNGPSGRPFKVLKECLKYSKYNYCGTFQLAYIAEKAEGYPWNLKRLFSELETSEKPKLVLEKIFKNHIIQRKNCIVPKNLKTDRLGSLNTFAEWKTSETLKWVPFDEMIFFGKRCKALKVGESAKIAQFFLQILRQLSSVQFTKKKQSNRSLIKLGKLFSFKEIRKKTKN